MTAQDSCEDGDHDVLLTEKFKEIFLERCWLHGCNGEFNHVGPRIIYQESDDSLLPADFDPKRHRQDAAEITDAFACLPTRLDKGLISLSNISRLHKRLCDWKWFSEPDEHLALEIALKSLEKALDITEPDLADLPPALRDPELQELVQATHFSTFGHRLSKRNLYKEMLSVEIDQQTVVPSAEDLAAAQADIDDPDWPEDEAPVTPSAPATADTDESSSHEIAQDIKEIKKYTDLIPDILQKVDSTPLRTAALLKGTIKKKLGTLGTVEEEDFTASPHFKNLTWLGKKYVLAKNAALIVETLYVAQKDYGIPGMHKDEIFAQIYGSNKKDWPSENTRVQYFFRTKDAKRLWDDGFIVHDNSGNFCLTLNLHTDTR
jgi:hypothetical protein